MHTLELAGLFSSSSAGIVNRNSPSKVEQQQRQNRLCRLCFEPGAIRRPCCNAPFCDHCYVKGEKCPNCNVLTKKEKLTGATFQLKVFSEVEECRLCLDPGLKRPCCGNYYCDACFYAAPLCRSCRVPVGRKRPEEEEMFRNQAYALTVFFGWLITIFFVIIMLTAIALVASADQATPYGIFDFGCFGFFRDCNYNCKQLLVFYELLCYFLLLTLFENFISV